ncbi:MAG TPA: DUF58 domain-containing protein [Gaiellaceae bacterium]
MLTDRGRWVLAVGGVTYLVAWAFGSEPLYPVAVGLVLAVAAAAVWVRILRRPMTLRRTIGRGEHVDGDDVPVSVELVVEGRLPAASLLLVERIARFGQVKTVLERRHGKLSGGYILERVPRGRYPIEAAEVVIEDPFGLERVDVELPRRESLLVYPRLVDVAQLFSDTGTRLPGGRRLLLRRPTGFELHSVREHHQGESLRRVHWPQTARRGYLMVKELEDAPRDEAAVLLDADGSVVVGVPPDSTFEVQVRAAGSILRAHAKRGRRSSLVINSSLPVYQRIHSFEGDWHRALELLASVEADGHLPAAHMLTDEAGPASRAMELTVVTAIASPKLVERLVQRAFAHHPCTVVYVDPRSFVEGPTPPDHDATAQLLRLDRAGIPVAVVRKGDDLAEKLSPAELGAAVG